MTHAGPTDHLDRLLSDGAGRWFGVCGSCGAASPGVPSRDDLKILAAATAAGWVAVPREGGPGGGPYLLVCGRCDRSGRG